MILTVDTFAWVEILRGSPTGSRASDALREAEACLTPAVVLAEVASVCLRNGMPDEGLSRSLREIRGASEIIPIDDLIAISAAHCAEELRRSARKFNLPAPGLADGLVLASCRSARSRLLTGDPHFQACRETLWLS